MDVAYAFLADAAEAHAGKFYVLGGGISILWRNQYPAPIGISAVVSFSYNAAEAGRDRTVALQVNDADGKPVIPPLEAKFTPGPRTSGVPKEAPLETIFAVTIGDAPVLPQPGLYAIEVLLDGNHVKSLPFVVAIRGGE